MPGRMSGFSLIELLVSMLIGLIVLASVVGIMADNLRHAVETERQGQLIEESTALSQFIYTELRRAGYSAAGQTSTPPYNQVILASAVGSDYGCLRFGYDSKRNDEKYFGFRLRNTALEWFASSQSTGWSCDSTDAQWQALHDVSAVALSALTFSNPAPTSGAIKVSFSAQLPNNTSQPVSTLQENHYVYPRNTPSIVSALQ